MAISVSARDRRDLNQIFKLMAASLSYNWAAFESGDGLGDVIVGGLSPLTDLASVLNGRGASLIGIEDSGGLITAVNVETALAELATSVGTKLAANSSKLNPTPATAGKIPYDTGSAYALSAAPGVGLPLLGAAGAPTWGATLAVVSFSATPAFTAVPMQSITMTANITSWTLADGSADQEVTIVFIQDGTGSRTLSSAGANIRLAGGALTLSTGANKADVLTFKWHSGLSKWLEKSRALNC